ncbi:MAG: MgtC/SapB family protein [Arcobacter sp.]|jgi:uncharacterized membrane protein (DUF4010 family)|uniref:DUF4010 domain-containing membrane protein n=1 Tax=Arcobacter defluvii TaxID=873191 RepID=A0AAE7BAW5_9BACT|nr:MULTISPECIES: DUF4010 domain-containing protein [Arcobacter]MDY3201512.1 DUF4010 domain-containing protein [Arcobacter sp.]QKF76120.1 DUF4010 domain-containing membrane protein [Arcobacter defluvii]RXI32276.1 DUF4010 domain-containing protein [Arcobacter defluvii]BAK71911.1 conserved hypothetical protein [Arcobacter sp. L]
MIIDSLFTHLIFTILFSFLIGLEIRAYKLKFHPTDKEFFGTARTYTFVGILGFIFYKIEPVNFSIYIAGFIGITLLFSLFYNRLLDERKHSIVLYLVLLIVYSFGPLSNLFPLWLTSLVFVLTIFLLNAKNKILSFNMNINIYEFETLGKMILLSAVVLPLLPEDKLIPYLGISLYKIWLTVVVISGISYTGYLVQKYLFPSKGIFLTGLIGGSYSSTATTVVLSKKAQTLDKNHIITASIIAATSMMYIRILIISYIFNFEVAKTILLPFLCFIVLTAVITFIYYKRASKSINNIEMKDSNPLELGTAFIFAFLFIITMLITNFVVENYGTSGLQFLSTIIGFTDIDPFILSLLTGKYTIESSHIASAIIISSGSNNILKAIYTFWFGKDKTYTSFILLLILGILTIAVGFLL